MHANTAVPALLTGVKRGRDVDVVAQFVELPKRPRSENVGEVLGEHGGPSRLDGFAESLAITEPAGPCTPVETFVVANSAVVKAALQDDASASWWLAFPPSLTVDAAAWERTLRNLAVLEKLHAEEPAEWMRILQVRTRPLYASISGCSGEELADMLHLTEYLQLPKQLAIRLNMQAEVLRLGKRLRSVFTGREMLVVLNSIDVLKPAVAAAMQKLVASLAGAEHICISSVWDGACGFLCDPYPDELERLLDEDEDAVNAIADRLGSFVAGQLLVGATRIRDVPRVLCRRSCVPAAVAAFQGDLRRLNALAALGWSGYSVLIVAYAEDRVPVLQWWDEHGLAAFSAEAQAGEEPVFDLYSEGQFTAANRGHVAVLRWTVETGRALQPGLDTIAAQAGAWGVLRYLRESVPGYPKSASAYVYAAEVGDLPLLEYLVSQGDPLDSSVVRAAASGGHTHVLEYLRAGGVPFSNSTCRVAAEQGQLETLQWLRTQYPPYLWDATTIEAAEYNGWSEVAAWARANGCPEPADALETM